MNFKLRDYQIEGVQACVDILTEKKRTCIEIVIAPTAAGKSIYVAKSVKEVDEPILVIQPTKELLMQNYEKFAKEGGVASICCASLKTKTIRGVPYTVLGNGEDKKCKEISKVTYATAGTVNKFISELKALGVKKAIVDECFPYKTPIVTSRGVEFIGDIHNKIEVGEDVHVQSYNAQTNTLEFKKVVASKNNGLRELLRIIHSSGAVECTPNHKLLTASGWKQVQDMYVGEALISSMNTSHTFNYEVLNTDQFDLVLGSALGSNGLVLGVRGNTLATLKLNSTHKDLLQWKSNILRMKGGVRKNKKRASSTSYTAKTKQFYLEPQYKDQKMQTSSLTFKSLAVLWMDRGTLDESNLIGRILPDYSARVFVNDLKLAVRELGIKGVGFEKTSNGYCLLFEGLALNELFEHCAQYIPKVLGYKVPSMYRSKLGKYSWDKETYNTVKIVEKIEQVVAKEVYDIEVEDNHNFIVPNKSAHGRIQHKISPREREVVLEGIIAHNCHINTKHGSQVRKLFKEVGITHIVGLTATPLYLESSMEGATLKMMNRAKWKLFSGIRHVTQIPHLVENKYWSKLNYKLMSTDETLLKANSSGSDFTLESQRAYYEENKLEEQIIKEVSSLISGGRRAILVFLPTISEAESLARQFKGSRVVHSKLPDKERDEIIRQFKNAEIQVIFNISILGTGFDYPQLDGIITARSTSSIALYYQQIGRGVRIHQDKEDCTVIDFSGNVNRFGLVEGLHYENLPYYGWGMFNADNELLTDFPTSAEQRPTKESLSIPPKVKTVVLTERSNPMFTFGMFKGRKIWDIAQSKDAKRLKSYCSWAYDKSTSGGMYLDAAMKKAMKEYLKIGVAAPF